MIGILMHDPPQQFSVRADLMKLSAHSDSNLGHLPTTHWPLVLAAGELEQEQGRAALGELVRRYEKPLLSYIQKRFCGSNPSVAKDLFDGFVEKILLEKEVLAGLQPLKGYQFRSFLFKVLRNYAVSEIRRSQAHKRKPEGGELSLDSLSENESPSLEESQSQEFDVAWARSVVERALERMQGQCLASGRLEVWGVFDRRLRAPILEGVPLANYADLVEQYGFASPTQAHNILVTAKRQFERCLYETVAEYVPDGGSIESELRELYAILAHG